MNVVQLVAGLGVGVGFVVLCGGLGFRRAAGLTGLVLVPVAVVVLAAVGAL